MPHTREPILRGAAQRPAPREVLDLACPAGDRSYLVNRTLWSFQKLSIGANTSLLARFRATCTHTLASLQGNPTV